MKKVLLLNPPAPVRVSRDYYCGHFTKGRYAWPPIDLLVLSGFLAEEFEVHVLDAVAEGLGGTRAHARIDAVRPDAVVSLVSGICWSSDIALLEEVKRRHGCPVVVSGDLPRAEPRQALASASCIDAVILDFTDNEVLLFLAGQRRSGCRNVVTRDDTDVTPSRGKNGFCVPLPRHDRFPLHCYHVPMILHHPFCAVLTDYGCPFACRFCYMKGVGHRRRDLHNVGEELAMVRSLGIRELMVADQSFGSARSHALAVCDAIRSVGQGRFGWFASIRVDAMDAEMLAAMRAAGCHTILVGVETPTQAVLDRFEKGIDAAAAKAAFERAKAAGMRILAHFMVGLDGEDAVSLRKLIDFSIALDPDMASFNVPMPAWGPSPGGQVEREKQENGEEVLPGTMLPPAPKSRCLSRDEIHRARDRAVRRFYLRPRFLVRQLCSVRSPYHLRTLFREGLHLVFNSVMRR